MKSKIILPTNFSAVTLSIVDLYYESIFDRVDKQVNIMWLQHIKGATYSQWITYCKDMKGRSCGPVWEIGTIEWNLEKPHSNLSLGQD